MADDDSPRKSKQVTQWRGDGAAGFAYFLGFIASAVYYIQQATTFWDGVIGVLKALVWPAFLVYGLLRSIGA